MAPVAFVLGMWNGGLAAVRPLGRAGIPVIGVDWDDRNPGCVSKYCAFARCPDPAEPDRLLEFFLAQGRRLDTPGIVFPATDDFVSFTTRYQRELSQYFRFNSPSGPAAAAQVDKRRQYELCRELGVPLPQTFYPANREELERIGRDLPYPAFLKPQHSHLWRARASSPAKGFLVRNTGELLTRFEELLPAGLTFMVQEVIPGPETNLHIFGFYISRKGELLSSVCVRKLRQYPVDFGIATLAETFHSPELADLCLRYCQGAGFRGIGMVECKLDPRDGRYKFLELNSRSYGHMSLAVDAGANFPLLQYQDLAGDSPVALPPAAVGVRWLDPLRDAVSSWRRYRRGELSPLRWLASWRGVTSHVNWARDDPRPFFHELSGALMRFSRRAL